MAYANNLTVSTGTQLPGSIPPQDDPWWVSVGKTVGGFFDSLSKLFHLGSGYPKPLPPPLPFTDSQIAAMLDAQPDIRRDVEANALGEMHVHLLVGYQPTQQDYDSNTPLLARVAHWLADGTGDDLSHGEADMRRLILQGMYNTAPATSSSGSSGGGTGTGTGEPTQPTGFAKAAVPSLLALGLLFSFMRRR